MSRHLSFDFSQRLNHQTRRNLTFPRALAAGRGEFQAGRYISRFSSRTGSLRMRWPVA
jgi:hypothetical protein